MMIELNTIPQPLYKYRDWDKPYNQRTLTQCEIYLASPSEFNDPFDASIPFKYKKDELTKDNIFKKLIEVGKSQWPNISENKLHEMAYKRQFSGVFESGEYWKTEYPSFKDRMNSFGIVSLTSKQDNLLMWSHYANSHAGICIGFDKNILFKTIRGVLGPVIYNDKFPEANLFNKEEENLYALTCTKFTDWQYEDEYRIAKIDSAKQVVQLPGEAILEVILGMNMTNENKDSIVELVRKKYPNATLYECSMSLEKFKLDMIPIFKN